MFGVELVELLTLDTLFASSSFSLLPGRFTRLSEDGRAVENERNELFLVKKKLIPENSLFRF